MAKPYSEDLRARVVGAVEDGATIPEAAKQCGVSISSVVRFLRLHRRTGTVRWLQGVRLAAHEDLVRQLVAEQPDITLAELETRLAKKKVTVGKSSISRFLHHLKLTFKKVCGPPSRTDRIAAARKALQKQQPRLDPKRLVFIDENQRLDHDHTPYGRVGAAR